MDFRKPTGKRIERTKGASRLYALETRRGKAIRSAAEELQRVLGLASFWGEAMPEALLGILESYDRKLATLVAETFLERQDK